MTNEYSNKFFKENIQNNLPDNHVAFFIQRAVGTKNDGVVAGVWHSTANLQGTKILLETALKSVNELIKNA